MLNNNSNNNNDDDDDNLWYKQFCTELIVSFGSMFVFGCCFCFS